MLSYGIRWVCARTASVNWSRVGRSTIRGVRLLTGMDRNGPKWTGMDLHNRNGPQKFTLKYMFEVYLTRNFG